MADEKHLKKRHDREAIQPVLSRRLRRAEGQLNGIQRMIEDGEPCVDVLMQISAVRGALGKVAQILLANHLETCVTEAIRGGDRDAQMEQIEDLSEIFARFGGMAAR
jgi:DNA-binding FrmR family transcriptional regulator